MKNRLLLVALGFASLASLPVAMRAEPVAAASEITAVTVYADRAIVAREASVDLAAGVQEVLFAGLPASLDPDLLQVAGEGTARATILEVRAASAQLESAANPRLGGLNDRKRAIEMELRALDDKATVLQQRRDYLERIKAASVAPPQARDGATVARPSVAEWGQYVAFYADGLAQVLADLQALDRERADVQLRLDAVGREIDALEAPDVRLVQNVTVRLDVAAAGSMKLKLGYTVREARWSPTYDVRVASADKSIVLGYSGMVAQSTGEDWKNVKLVLSTARPAVGGTPPELATWFLDREQPMPPPMPMAAPEPEAFYKGRAMASAGLPEEDLALSSFEVATASVEAGLTSATFTIPSPADIPADNSPHKVAIAQHKLEGRLSHLAVPKLAELAYLRADVTNNSDFPLIAGPVNMFLDGTFVARSNLATVMPAEKLTLDLGVDDGISIKRKLLNRLQEDTGLVTRKQKITYDVVITVQNNRQTAETVVVKDQLPIARHEKIVVSLVAPPLREVKKDDDGTITWTLDLKAGEKRELPLKISIEYPTDFPVSGLE